MQREDRLLEGALDVHAHGYPEFTLGMPPRVDNVTWAQLAADAGMRGFVVKSHVWPTTTTAHMLGTLHPELEVLGGITCNPPTGGLNPVSVELAAQTGGRIVWMPTWSAQQEPPKPSIFRDRMRPFVQTLETNPEAAPDIGVLDSDGSLLPEVLQILQLCRRYDMVLATGHLPIKASLVLAEEAESRGVRLLLTHPLSGSVGASINDQRTVVAHGGTVEHVFVGCMPMHQRMEPAKILDAINAVGAENCVLGSDAIEAWNPPAPELLRMFIATLLALGLPEGAVHLMTHDNPERLLGLSSHARHPHPEGADTTPGDVQ